MKKGLENTRKKGVPVTKEKEWDRKAGRGPRSKKERELVGGGKSRPEGVGEKGRRGGRGRKSGGKSGRGGFQGQGTKGGEDLEEGGEGLGREDIQEEWGNERTIRHEERVGEHQKEGSTSHGGGGMG